MIKPLLAYKKPPGMTDEQWVDELPYPLLATPKIDGIRCTIQEGNGWTRSHKLIPNAYVRDCLRSLPDFLDGELTCGQTFQAVTSGIMSYDGKPDFRYFVFDAAFHSENLQYQQRTQILAGMSLPDFCIKLIPTIVQDKEALLAYEIECLAKGAEGVMLRSASSLYIASRGKENRSNKTRPYLMAVKRFEDDEAVIVGVEEQKENTNPATRDALGRIERSTHAEGMVPKDTMGALLVKNAKFGEFRIGTGFDDSLRKRLWVLRSSNLVLGATIKFKYQSHGVLDKPRIPVFLGFRHVNDL